MGHTFYDGTIVVAQSILSSLSHILHQAEERPYANSLLEARINEDMYPLPDRTRIVAQFSENLVARLTDREPMTFEGNPAAFAKCYERIETVLKALNEADKDIVNQNAGIAKATQLGPATTVQMSDAAYAHTIIMPNLFFHLVTAYGILRKEGVPLGKQDYYTGFFPHLRAGSQ